LGLEVDRHIDFCIAAMQAQAESLGLEGAPVSSTT
jgi:hypothetical protein